MFENDVYPSVWRQTFLERLIDLLISFGSGVFWARQEKGKRSFGALTDPKSK